MPLFEPLEPRLLLAGSLVLTEFPAVNTRTGPADKDGAYSPWSEIRNTTGSPDDALQVRRATAAFTRI